MTTTTPSLLVTRHLQRQSVAILSKPACIWRFDERDRNTGALQLERHGLVARQPRKIGPERKEKGVDPQFPHAIPHARQPRRSREARVRRRAERAAGAHDTSAVLATATATPDATTARFAW